MLAAAALAVLAGAATAGAAPTITFPTSSFGADGATAFSAPGLDLFATSAGLGGTTGLDQVFTPAIADLASANPLAGTTSTQGTPPFTTGGTGWTVPSLVAQARTDTCELTAHTPETSGPNSTIIFGGASWGCNDPSARWAGGKVTACLEARPLSVTNDVFRRTNKVGTPTGDWRSYNCGSSPIFGTGGNEGVGTNVQLICSTNVQKVGDVPLQQWRTRAEATAVPFGGSGLSWAPVFSKGSLFRTCS